jgi:hypothetical protein
MDMWPGQQRRGALIRLLILVIVTGIWICSIPACKNASDPPAHSAHAVQPAHISSATRAANEAYSEQMQTHYNQLQLLHQLHGPDGWTWFTSLPEHRLVIFYGNPLAAVMGPIGQYDDEDLIAHLQAQAQIYRQLDPSHPVVPALDYVTPLAQPIPMSDNSWTYRMPDDSIKHYVDLARDHHVLFFFDMQIGHSPIQKEVEHLWPYLEQPWVDLSLDPEFDMAPGDVPGQEFGRMKASEINWVIDQLSQLVQTRHLPPKTLIIHQFLEQMLPDWQKIKLQPGVQVVTCVDGFGQPGAKMDDYYMFNNQQRIQYPGMKLFYNLDKPLMSPSDVLALKPSPLMVMYQ